MNIKDNKLPSARELAKPSCKSCYGIGIKGRLISNPQNTTLSKDSIKEFPREDIVCRCVERGMIGKVPWLQRRGDEQPWLHTSKEDTKGQAVA